ncbi:MAG TPA: SusC/RagA family TonB-linked outer membrane protein [Gemmatimonadales bacterium]|nr:SusC/RagA family TonB-linked outer membrane protein [Gemmatimonadales bacterium]
MVPSSSTRLLGAAGAVLALLAAATASLHAQAAGRIQGRVVDANSLRPISGVQVFIAGGSRAALTDASGGFAITDIPVGEVVVRAKMIGFSPAEQRVTVTGDQPAQAELRLRATAIELDAVVVTGTPGPVSKRTLGNPITTIDADAMTRQTAISNVGDLLQSKAPGVQILPNSGTPGTRADIRIRGANGLTGYEPVIYVDGVRFNSDNLGTFTPSGAGTTSFRGQQTSALDLINPADIESIEIIKGPAAATLYGAEAANGVIQIITKKGARGAQTLRFDVKVEQAANGWELPIPDNYTVCTTARIAERDAGGNIVWPGCQGVQPGALLIDNPLRRDPLALRTGGVQRVSLSARGGGERFSYYVAATGDRERGVFYNSFNDRNSVRANFTVSSSAKLDFQINSSYVQGELGLPVGDEAAQGMLLSAARGQPGRVPPAGDTARAGWGTTNAAMANAYNNRTKSDRFTIGTTVNAQPFPWFRNRLTLGLDYTTGLAEVISPPGSVDAGFASEPGGLVAQRYPRNLLYTIDYAGNLEFGLNPDLRSTTSLGVQATARRRETLVATGRGFGAPELTLISTAQVTAGSNSFVEARNLGYFVQEQLGWKNRLFVTGAVRADDHSAFGRDFDLLLYPKASVSWILSEEPALGRWLDAARVTNLKLRMAYGHAGRAPDPFAATQAYTGDRVVVGGVVRTGLRPLALGNDSLRAERGEEVELGFDAGLLENRVGVEFTYYDRRMKDVIYAPGVPGSTGFGGTFYGATQTLLVNLGEVSNTGVEVALTATPVRLPDFVWDARLNLATNHNELVSFGDPGRVNLIPGGQSYGTVQQHREGYPLAGYWAALPRRNPDGTPVLVGTAVQLDTATFIGPSAPTREIGFSSTFTLFRDLRLFVLFDYKGGHFLFNQREFDRCRVRANCARLADPRNVDPVTGAALNPEVNVWRQNVPGVWVEPAHFLKLRDVSVSYAVPTTWARRARANSASITLAAHNVALWSDYSGFDPEVNSYGDVSFSRADAYPVPMLRRVSASLNLSF